MSVRFAKAYIDRLFDQKDFSGIHHAISVIEGTQTLPNEFWLFCRIYEWAPARSGVWQYYDGLKKEEFERVNQTLEQFGLAAISEKYRLGKATWNDSDQAATLDAWLESEQENIYEAIFRLIASQRDLLTGQP